MTTKHNCKHPDRSKSNYAARLVARGLSKSPRLEELDVLEKRQLRRELETGSPWWVPSQFGQVTADDLDELVTTPNPKAEELLRSIFQASVPDDELVRDVLTHDYIFTPNTGRQVQ